MVGSSPLFSPTLTHTDTCTRLVSGTLGPAHPPVTQLRSWMLLLRTAPCSPPHLALFLLLPSLHPPAPGPRTENSGPASAAKEEAGGAGGKGEGESAGEKKKVNSLALRARCPPLPRPSPAEAGRWAGKEVVTLAVLSPSSHPPPISPTPLSARGPLPRAPGSFEFGQVLYLRSARVDAVAAAGERAGGAGEPSAVSAALPPARPPSFLGS